MWFDPNLSNLEEVWVRITLGSQLFFGVSCNGGYPFNTVYTISSASPPLNCTGVSIEIDMIALLHGGHIGDQILLFLRANEV